MTAADDLRVLPGRSLASMEEAVHRVHDEANSFQAQSGVEGLAAWAQWAASANRTLEAQLGSRVARDLVFTSHYLALLAASGPTVLTQINAVRGTLAGALGDLLKQIKGIRTWWDGITTAVVLDTNMLVQTTPLFPEIDWPSSLGIADNVHLVVPMAVVDELDSLKRDHKARRAAREALRALEGILDAPGQRARLHPAEGGPFSSTLEVLDEAPSHVRLPNTDSEIVAAAVHLAEAGCGDVYFATWDTGARFRATAAERVRVTRLPANMERQD